MNNNIIFKDFYLNFKVLPTGFKPQRFSKSAGIDFFSPANYIIPPYGDAIIPLDVICEFPDGYAMIFKEKSGIAIKKKLSIGACVIDSEYRGIIHAHLFNHSDKTIEILRGEKIVQAIIIPVWIGEFNIVDKFISEQTIRNDGKFGSTGEKIENV